MIEPSEILDALASVRDPELDTSIVKLGFVTACWLDDTRTAHIRLHLPTYFCAPNFAYLMVSDAHDAVVGLDGIDAVDISLEDHFASHEINVGVAARTGFVASFDGLAERDLGELRRTFLRKAALAAQDRVLRPLLAAGLPPGDLATLTLADLPPSADRDRLRSRREQLGLPAGDDDPVLLQLEGAPVSDADVAVHLRRTRTVRVSMDANSDVCRQLLAKRYPEPTQLDRR